jgi:hypothetical protein
MDPRFSMAHITSTRQIGGRDQRDLLELRGTLWQRSKTPCTVSKRPKTDCHRRARLRASVAHTEVG